MLWFEGKLFRSDGSESPPPPLPFPTFRFTSHPSDLVLYGRDLMEALGESSLHRPLSLLSETNLPFQWAPRPSTAVDVQWASSLGTSSSPSFYRPLPLGLIP
uniref:Uncharacterized protein n=1 Tax=Fagus sylvatica TaxID=28930 RepID=A0A2N9EGZ7_FAGSY